MSGEPQKSVMIITSIRKAYNKYIYRPYIKNKVESCGVNFRLGYASELRNAKSFSFGNHFFSGPYGYFVTNKYVPVKIGNNVMFGPFCKIFGGNHDIQYLDGHINAAPEKAVKGIEITIEDGVWIGANTTLLNNAYISEGAVVSSGAIVNGYIPPYCVGYGMPAKRFKKRFESNEELQILLTNVKSKYSLEEILEIYEKYGVG